MDYTLYLDKFQKAANQLNKNVLAKKKLEVSVGIVLDSVYLKLYKKEWTNDADNPLTATTRIFFSVWVNDSILLDEKVFYNIHALKLRHLKGYAISSRDFATTFRKHFKEFEPQWENVSVKFGPLTLMEGWQKVDSENLEATITSLANNFLTIETLIDKTLSSFKK